MLKDEFKIQKGRFNGMVEKKEKNGERKKRITLVKEEGKNNEQSNRQDGEQCGNWVKSEVDTWIS
ncbi:MAG: hypothetical protein QTN59_05190 [Candidatus Electrothrix communis]|nr:MAG: hypothetical protein QTN59_05190 [Candidatus Electrothrix communis]